MRDVRDRQYDLAGQFDRLPGAEMDGSAAMLLQTFAESAYPTDAAAVYACHPCLSDADDTEGASTAITTDTSATFYAANLGTAIPDEGTYVLASAVGGRWVFRYDG